MTLNRFLLLKGSAPYLIASSQPECSGAFFFMHAHPANHALFCCFSRWNRFPDCWMSTFVHNKTAFKAGPPLEAILVIFGRRALIFFCLKALGKKWKMTPLLCACAVVITLETQKCRKRAPRSVEFNFFNNCDRHKRFLQNERRGADLQKFASDILIFA